VIIQEQYKFSNLDEMTEFCKYINLINQVDITAMVGKNQEVDAKSFVGLLALGLSNVITFHITGIENNVSKVKKWFEIHMEDVK
jgi:phosphotransferase system HPr-like phosphotransfer protein